MGFENESFCFRVSSSATRLPDADVSIGLHERLHVYHTKMADQSDKMDDQITFSWIIQMIMSHER